MRPSLSYLSVVCVSTVAVLALADAARADVIAVSSAVKLVANSNAGAGTVTNTSSQSQAATTNPLTASVDAIAVNGNASVETTGVGNASWISPSSGQVTLSRMGWTTANVASGSADLVTGLDYSYTFTATTNGTMTVGYSIGGAGSDTFGLNGINYNFDGDNRFLNFPSSGTITETLVGGTTYTLHLRNQANIAGALGTRDAHMEGDFKFLINTVTVPEPGTVILAGIGLIGLACYSGRRRKTA